MLLLLLFFFFYLFFHFFSFRFFFLCLTAAALPIAVVRGVNIEEERPPTSGSAVLFPVTPGVAARHVKRAFNGAPKKFGSVLQHRIKADHILPLRVGSYSGGTSVLRSLERRTRLCFVVDQDSREQQDSTEREGAATHGLLQSAVREAAEGIAARLSLAP